MSHGTAVFERSYQTPHISTDLMKIAFGGRAGDYEKQFARISSVFSRRDPFSPLYLTAQELAEFEKRQDISSLRLAYEDATKNNEQQAEELKSRIKYIIDYLEKLKLAEKRNEYFEAADDLRARGLSTAHLRQPGETNPKRQKDIPGCKASPVVGVLFQNNVDATQLVANLVLYLEGRLPAPKDMQHQPDGQMRLPKIRKTKIQTRKLCLICNITCATKATLSRHVERTHTFEEAFECPACRQTGHHVIVDAGAVQWAKHVEQQHGKQLAPDPFFSQKPAYCLICSTSHAIRGFSLHFSKAHEKESQYPFDCRECGQKGVVAKIHDRRSWIRHAMEVHGSKDPMNGSVLEGEFDTVLQSKKRKRSVSVLDSDAGELSSRFPIGTGEDEEFWVTGRDSDYLESEN
ncbi:hypothetical protein LEL_08983 [Akanthomyces lecanii RCEF 1005]|uniref:C2H2-type domain-containing protein n=1 Tax=Akanthomyces lecanii RCEF 1005 TaxID=1081108 RepID=A0A168CST0_CORDF|nr:hypothetical protein LEL_08983 [Akanthomyces lecanii RCEF 1005]